MRARRIARSNGLCQINRNHEQTERRERVSDGQNNGNL